MANKKVYPTRKKAVKAVKKANPGKKVVTVSKRTIKKYGPSITKSNGRAGYGKQKPGVKGKKRKPGAKVVSGIKYVVAVPKKPKKTKPAKKKITKASF